VVIGRGGSVFWRDGFYWVAITTVLGVEETPVQVLAHHGDRQTVREAIATGSTPPIGVDSQWTRDGHPDLQDVA